MPCLLFCIFYTLFFWSHAMVYIRYLYHHSSSVNQYYILRWGSSTFLSNFYLPNILAYPSRIAQTKLTQYSSLLCLQILIKLHAMPNVLSPSSDQGFCHPCPLTHYGVASSPHTTEPVNRIIWFWSNHKSCEHLIN